MNLGKIRRYAGGVVNDAATATIQSRLAYIYSIGFFIVLFTLIFCAKGLNEFVRGILLTMVGYLGAIVQQQSSYFFARQRPDTPAMNTTTTTSTSTEATPGKDAPDNMGEK